MSSKYERLDSLQLQEKEYVAGITKTIADILSKKIKANIKVGLSKRDSKYGMIIDLDGSNWKELPLVLIHLSSEIKRDYIEKISNVGYSGKDGTITIKVDLFRKKDDYLYPKKNHVFSALQIIIDVYGKNPKERDLIGKKVIDTLNNRTIKNSVRPMKITFVVNPPHENPGKSNYGSFYRKTIRCEVVVERKADKKEFEQYMKKRIINFP